MDVRKTLPKKWANGVQRGFGVQSVKSSKFSKIVIFFKKFSISKRARKLKFSEITLLYAKFIVSNFQVSILILSIKILDQLLKRPKMGVSGAGGVSGAKC